MSRLSIPGSGLAFASAQLQAAASNIANLRTEGYEPRRVRGTEDPGGGVSSREIRDVARPAEPSTGSRVRLEEEAVATGEAVVAYQANGALIRAERETVGQLLDLLA